jgi:HEAT repeat protein
MKSRNIFQNDMGDLMRETERNSNERLENYLKNIILKDRTEDKNEICNYVELAARETLPITRRLFEENLTLIHEFKISQLIEKEKHLIIYGEAGSGKTSTLKWLNSTFSRDCIEGKGEYIPLYVSLDSYSKGSFYDYLKIKAKQKGISAPDFRKLLEGKALLLLDGLGLLTSTADFSPLKEVSSFISDYEDCRYVIASRHGPSGSIKSTFAVCELEKLSDEKIGIFIENHVPNKRQAKLLKKRILNKINSHPFLRNPLLLELWIGISVARMGNTGKNIPHQEPPPFDSDFVPSNRAELYQTFISDLFRNYIIKEEPFSSENALFREITDSEEANIGKKEIEYFLMDLAFKFQCRKKISCKYSYVLEFAEKYAKQNISDRTEDKKIKDKKIESKKTEAKQLLKTCFKLGLLTRSYSEVRFGIDRSFQEYFAALKLKTCIENGVDISEICRHPAWENVVILTSEIVESGDELVNSLVSNGNLVLASKCVGKASPEIKEKLCSELATRLDSKYTVEKMRAIRSLGRMGACWIEASSKVLEDKDIGIKREAVRALGRTKSEIAIAPITAALEDWDYSVRIEAVKALSMIGSEKAIETLTSALEDRNRAVRLEATDALVKIGSKKAFEVLISALGAKDDFVRFGAIGALGRANPQKAAGLLIKTFQDDNKLVRLGAAEALGQMGSERAVEPFLAALQDEDEFVRWMATKALGKIKSDETLERFTDVLGDKSHYVRREAAKALGMVNSEKTLDLLVSALSDEDEFVRKAAIEALGERRYETAVSETAAEALVNMLNDESHFVRLEAAKALGMVRFREAVSPLLFVLGDENRFVRKEAANALGQLESEKVLELLIQALDSENQFVRQGAVRALGQITSGGDQNQKDRVFDSLDSAFGDKDKLVRREAARSLENISKNMPERAFQSLMNALDDEDEEVRRLLVGVLKRLESRKSVSQLVRALKSGDPIVRRFAAEALGQTGSEKALVPLIDTMLFDPAGFVQGEAALSLGKIGSQKAVEPLIDALLDEDSEGKWGAAEALGRIKAEAAVTPLILALTDKDDFTRLAAAKALGRIKTKKAIEPLINTLYDWNRFVKAEAAGALMKICTKEEKERIQALLSSEDELAANLAFEILEEIEMEEISNTTCFLTCGKSRKGNGFE